MTDSPFAITAILWWEILNMVLYTPLAVFGLAATIGYASGLLSFGDGAGMGCAMIIDIAMGFYHTIFTSTGIYIISEMKMHGGIKFIYDQYVYCIIFRAIGLLVALLISTLGIMSGGAEDLPIFMAIGYAYRIPEYVFLAMLKSEIK